MQARIIKGIGGFYYCRTQDGNVLECKAKGGFRKQGIKPLPGDAVDVDTGDVKEGEGTIVQIAPRKNLLLRPAVANVDQVLIEFAVADPEPNFNLLDRMLISMERRELPILICFNKVDLIGEEERTRLAAIYEHSGFPYIFVSTKTMEGMDAVKEALLHKTTAFAGPSGVGKSSLLNAILPEVNLKTGAVSEKIRRGKHTTRHTELIPVGEDTYLIDTPGFSSLYVDAMEPEDLSAYYAEFVPYAERCRFQPCSHVHEPDCGVRQAVEAGDIHKVRYENYVTLYRELKNH